MSLHEDLKAYVDRELPPDRMAEIEAAIQADPVLRAEVDEIRGLSHAVRALGTTPDPVGLERTLRALQRRPWWSPAGMQGRLAWGAAAAVLIVVAFATLLPREGIRDAATMSETASWTKQPTAERAAIAPSAESKPESAMAGAEPGAPPAMARKVAPDDAANLSRAMETAAPSADALPSTADKEVTQGAAEAHVNKSFALDDVPSNTTVRFRVADPGRAEAELQAVAAPLGGYAVRNDGEILVEIPKDRREDVLREMRRVGSVEEVPGEEAKSDLRPRRAGSDTVTITAKVEPASEPPAPTSPEANGRPWILASLVGLAVVALAGLVWSLRRR
jgi:hypothetical protein